MNHLLIALAALFLVQFSYCTKEKDYERAVYEGGADHECYRTCVVGDNKVCVYNFSVGEYATLSSKCGDCIYNSTGCNNIHCITAGGWIRDVQVVNEMLPGPGIHVCLNDTIVVNVKNVYTSKGLTIHWHGIHQYDRPYMDGTPYITQCPIESGDEFQYNFRADIPGTHMWHSHLGLQEADGVFGPLVVRRPDDPSFFVYDFDLPEHSMLVWHWYPKATSTVLRVARNRGVGAPSTGIIVNGKGVMEDTNPKWKIPRAEFVVKKGYRYRFRLAFNSAPYCPVQVSVDNHTLLMIASDAGAIKPLEVESFMGNAGERYDFVITADQIVDNYWIRFRGVGSCDAGSTQIHQAAILRYEGAPLENPKLNLSYAAANAPGRLLNPVEISNINYENNQLILVSELTSIDEKQNLDLSGTPDKIFYMEFNFNFYLNNENFLGYPQVNNKTFVFPQISLLTQRDELTPASYCTYNDSSNQICDGDFCTCPFVYEIDYDDLVEIVMVDTSLHRGSDHPFHIHGTFAQVVAMEPLKDYEATVHHVKKRNEEGKITKKLHGAPIKDTISVPTQGFAIMRFKAINPGFWFFHCHISSHAELGMGVIIHQGPNKLIEDTPANFPKCGNWKLPVL